MGRLHSHAAWLMVSGCAALVMSAAVSTSPTLKPMLFMDPSSDLVDPWGLLEGKPNALTAHANLTLPPANYSAGATVFAAFPIDEDAYEVFVAIGRPGEPLLGPLATAPGNSYDGISVNRYTTVDFKVYSRPTAVLFLPNGPTNDGNIWTVKSMDRNTKGYLLIAFYGDSASSFQSPLNLSTDSFKQTQKIGIFKDHDDTNLIWSRETQLWVDMQIFASPWLTPDGTCPHNLSDNGGCDGGPRTVTVRTSKDGRNFTGDMGCVDPSPFSPFDPSVRKHCKKWNESNLIRPSPTEDPPEMEFYRMRPFYVGQSGRLAAHTLQYAPSPAEMNNISTYGYWGPYCPNPAGGFIMCHKGHGYGKMHGPHIMEEWWVSSVGQNGPEDLRAWQRPYKRFRAVPVNVWLMSMPVVYNDQHVWVSDTAVYTLPLYRIAGVFAPANGEFSTHAFALPSDGINSLWMNVDALWKGNLVTGGCDEGCAAYVMVSLLDGSSNQTLPGFERAKCINMNVTGLRVPLKWTDAPKPPSPGTLVRLRFFFRDATIYGIGSGTD